MAVSLSSISIIILNHNGREYLEECLNSVLPDVYDSCEILLVDNASTDDSIAFVRNNFPRVRIVESKTNLGFAGGNNLGVEHARGDLIVLLNNDTRVEEHWLRGLVNAVQSDTVAVASSLVKTQGIPERYYEKNGTMNLLGQNIMRAFDEPTDIFYAGGTSLIYKKHLLGLPFDPDYFAYAEDVYLSLRARFLGYHVKHTNESCVFHYGSRTAKKKSLRTVTYYQERNRLLNIFLFFSPLTLVRLIPLFVANAIAKLIISVFVTRWSFAGLVQSYLYLLIHPYLIYRKRAGLKPHKKLNEQTIIALMSGKLTNGEKAFEKVLNAISLIYCRVVGLKTIELGKK